MFWGREWLGSTSLYSKSIPIKARDQSRFLKINKKENWTDHDHHCRWWPKDIITQQLSKCNRPSTGYLIALQSCWLFALIDVSSSFAYLSHPLVQTDILFQPEIRKQPRPRVKKFRNKETADNVIGSSHSSRDVLVGFLKTTVASMAISPDSVKSSGQSATRASTRHAIDITTPQRYNCSYRECFLYLGAIAFSHTPTKKNKQKYLFTDGSVLQRIYVTTEN